MHIRARRIFSFFLVLNVILVSELRAEAIRLEPEYTGRARISSGEVLPPFHLTVGGSIDGFQARDFSFQGDTYDYIGSRLFFIYGVLPNLQARFDLKYARGHNGLVSPATLSVFGDSDLSLRYIVSVVDSFAVGGELIGSLYAGVPGHSKFFQGGRLDARQVARYSLGRVRIDENLGFVWDRSGKIFTGGPTLTEAATYDLGDYNRIALALRPSVVVDRYLPYVEMNFDFPLAAPISAGRGTKEIAIGLGIELPKSIYLNAAGRFGMDRPRIAGYPTAAPWRVIFGAAYDFDAKAAVKSLLDWFKTYPTTVNIAVFDATRKQLIETADIVLTTPDGVTRGRGRASWTGIGDAVTYVVTAPYFATATGTVRLVEGAVLAERVELLATRGWVRALVSTPAGDGKA